MTESNQNSSQVTAITDAIGDNTGTLKIIAFGLVAIGVFALFATKAFAIAIETVVAWSLFLAAILSISHAFSVRRWAGSLFDIIRGVVYGAVAYIMLVDPLSGVVSLGIVLAVLFGVDGGAKIYQSVTHFSGSNRLLGIFSGLLSVGIAALMLMQMPAAAPLILSIIVGINLIVTGVGLLAIANAVGKSNA